MNFSGNSERKPPKKKKPAKPGDPAPAAKAATNPIAKFVERETGFNKSDAVIHPRARPCDHDEDELETEEAGSEEE